MLGEPIVVTGPPGAGKSTVSALLADLYEPSALIEGDAFFAFVRRGYVEPWKPESQQQNTTVVEAAAAATGRLAAYCSVVYDGVIGPWYVERFLATASVPVLHYVVLLPSLENCLERVQLRTGHGFTDLPATRHMYEQFAATSPEVAAHVVAAEVPPRELANLVYAGVASGEFRYPARA